MTRSTLLGAVSAVALTVSSGAFAAHPSITGGGSTLAEFDYLNEFAAYNAGAGATAAIFNNPDGGSSAVNTLYWPAGSGSGQSAFLNNDLTCDANKVLTNTGCSGVLLETIYGASDATLSSAQISGWATSTYGQAKSGNLIQLPSMGVGISFPTVNKGVTTNGQVSFNDATLCAIFSGKIVNWSTIANQPANKGLGIVAGPIQVVYRADGSGTSFLLTNHLSAVCTAANSAPGVTFTATTSFASIFTGAGLPIPKNFYGENGSGGIANYISGLGSSNNNPAFTGSAVTYLSPDFTTIDPNSNAVLSNGQKSALVVAQAATGSKYYLPTTANITLGLAHPKVLNPAGASAPPATAQQAAQTAAYVPLIETVTTGYPVVGYTTFDFAQCYTNKAIQGGVIAFLKGHYNTASYLTTQTNNGFVGISNSAAAKYLTAIKTYILGATDLGTNIGSASACKGLTGR